MNAQPYSGSARDPYHGGGSSSVMTTGNWFVTQLLLAIPIVGLILLFVWAFGENANVNKRNLSRAYLLLFLILIGVGLAISMLSALIAASGS
ncbi:hypothetical protein B8V81_1047 [Paenibacillus pasadenensis]|uniref:Uncharacterized protein n=1 Tax=Paenibacillus pasadenensis TaxID=217090 RepID=A0A2N5N919_9BACL|nr:hypothetical protein [Paenibacillus pasadenensis]PLT46823.1 hypothetical protein B8V81_1047 [Paenibacillus pasadenensis]